MPWTHTDRPQTHHTLHRRLARLKLFVQPRLIVGAAVPVCNCKCNTNDENEQNCQLIVRSHTTDGWMNGLMDEWLNG